MQVMHNPPTKYTNSEVEIQLQIEGVGTVAFLTRTGMAIDMDDCPVYSKGNFPLVAHHSSGLYYRNNGEWLPLDNETFQAMRHLLWSE
jgi:predicted oxidoreductase (fatty acid repression mutant protein)